MDSKRKIIVIGDPGIGYAMHMAALAAMSSTIGQPDVIISSGDKSPEALDFKTASSEVPDFTLSKFSYKSMDDLIGTIEEPEPYFAPSPTNPYLRNKNFKKRKK